MKVWLSLHFDLAIVAAVLAAKGVFGAEELWSKRSVGGEPESSIGKHCSRPVKKFLAPRSARQ
jgi:hypothetical protein